LFTADDDGIERQVLCYAAVSAYIPQHIQKLLPTRFLRSAIVDSYVAERCLLEYDREAFDHTVVYPDLSFTDPTTYQLMFSATFVPSSMIFLNVLVKPELTDKAPNATIKGGERRQL